MNLMACLQAIQLYKNIRGLKMRGFRRFVTGLWLVVCVVLTACGGGGGRWWRWNKYLHERHGGYYRLQRDGG